MHHRQLCAVSSAPLLLLLLPGVHLNWELEADTALDAASAAQEVVVSEFYPRALSKDEYFVITSLSNSAVNLRNWSITDGEGTLRFTNDTVINHAMSLAVSMNASAFHRAYGRYPDFALDSPAIQGSMSRSGTFALADTGDSISLLNPAGEVVDSVGYGDSPESLQEWRGAMLPNLHQGEVAKRIVSAGIPQDTDCSSDWMTFREHKYGYTEIEPFTATLGSGKLVAFTSPDCSLDAVTGAVDSAEDRIRICSYEFSSRALTCSLLEALNRGVEVTILVDGSPAGGMDGRQVDCLSVLRNNGAVVTSVNGNLSLRIVQHCGAMHAKYMVIDSTTSLVLSENFVESGIPEDRVFANRGWGVMFDDAGIAGYLSQLFDSDSRLSRADVKDWLDDSRYVPDSVLPSERSSNHSEGLLSPWTSRSEARITIAPSPDSSSVAPYLEPLLACSSNLMVEQFQVDMHWQNRWTGQESLSPLLGSVISGMRRGVEVQMLMDSSWFNSARNEEVVDFLVSTARNESLGGTFKCLDSRSPISVVHNKGVIVDHRFSLVSSNNWCRASFACNREIAAVIDSSEIAEYFEEAFALDWEPDNTEPNASAGSDIDVVVGQSVLLDGSGSSDDRAVVGWRWDLDSDGVTDASGCRISHSWSDDGNYRVTLYVEDAWGNRAKDEIVVHVLPDEITGAGPLPEVSLDAAFGITVTGAFSLFVGVLLARWRLNRSRKFNHPDSD